MGPASYCACVASADPFLDRLKPLVHQAGFGHDGLDTVVKIADGGPWIWNRMSEFNRPGVQGVRNPGLHPRLRPCLEDGRGRLRTRHLGHSRVDAGIGGGCRIVFCWN